MKIRNMGINPLSRGIQFFLMPDGSGGGGGGDHFDEQDHEREKENKGSGTKEGDPTYEERKANFFKGFGARGNAPVELGGDPNSKPNVDAAKQMEADSKRHQEEDETRRKESEKVGEKAQEGAKKPPFVKQQIERARTAEQERDEYKAKVEQYEKDKIESEKKIADMQAKIDSGELSPAKERELTDKIANLEKQTEEDKKALVNENARLKDKVSLYDLQENDTFKEKYVKPIEANYTEAVKLIGQDEKQQELFQQALVANASIFQAKDANSAAKFEKQRDALLTQIIDNMPGFTGTRFTATINSYLQSTYSYSQAIRDWKKTSSEIQEKAKLEMDKEYADRLQAWDKTYRTTETEYKEFTEMSEEEKKLAKELGIDVDDKLKRAGTLASKVITGHTSMPDTIDLIHKGRVHEVMVARLAVANHKIKSQEALIAKLRKGTTTGGESDGSDTHNPPPPEKKTRADFHKNFSANRPELQGQSR